MSEKYYVVWSKWDIDPGIDPGLAKFHMNAII
jgi:hypothetical protein